MVIKGVEREKWRVRDILEKAWASIMCEAGVHLLFSSLYHCLLFKMDRPHITEG